MSPFQKERYSATIIYEHKRFALKNKTADIYFYDLGLMSL